MSQNINTNNVNSANNVGSGVGVFKQKTGSNLDLKTLVAGSGITLLVGTDDITINGAGGGGSGETNTASNVGAGDGVFKQKVGVDLEFKTLIGGTNVTLTTTSNEITINALGGGGGSVTVTNPATPYSINNSEVVLWDCSGGNKIVDLPDATLNLNMKVTVKKTDSTTNTITITPLGINTIDDGASAVISTQYVSLTVISNGVNWFII